MTLLIIIFAVTLIYFSITERFKTYAILIGLQGMMLFGIAIFKLTSTDLPNLIFIVSETLLFKGIIVPFLLFKIIRENKIHKVHNKAIPGFYSLISISFGLLISVILAKSLNNKNVDFLYFTISLFSLYTGLFLIIGHKKIFSHLIGFLIIENAVFLLSVAIGSEMPMLINTAILLDIFVSVLILGVFLNKIGDKMNDFESEKLTKLKD